MAPPQTLSEAAACGRLRWAVSCAFGLNLWPTVQSIPVEVAYCVASRRNDSLGSRGRWRIFAALCTVSVGLALAFGRLLRLALCSAGERVSFGDDLSAAERESVTRDLRYALAVR